MVRTLFMTMPSMVGIVGRAPAVDEEVWCFFVFVTLWNYKVCDNGNAMKQYYYQNNYGVVITETLWSSIIIKTIMVSLHAERFVVVLLYSTFSVDPQNFSTEANLYQKLRLFAIFAAVGPHFLKSERWNLVRRCGPGTPSTTPNFVKIA